MLKQQGGECSGAPFYCFYQTVESPDIRYRFERLSEVLLLSF